LQTEFWHFVLLERRYPETIKHAIRIGSQATTARGLSRSDVDNWARYGRQQ